MVGLDIGSVLWIFGNNFIVPVTIKYNQ
jgi:hypothetical protein